MVVNYDISAIEEFLSYFTKITNLTISFWDNDLNQLTYQPSVMPKFCRMIKSSPIGKKRCLLDDKQLCSQCSSSLEPATHKCHAGLVDTAMPIMFDDKLFGFIMFGQVKEPDFPKSTYDEIKKIAKELDLPADELYEAYNSLKVFDMDIIKAASKILNATMYYLYSSVCKFTEDELVTRIDEWIVSNLSSQISISQICGEFDISKNKLYSLWNNKFGVTVGEYVLKKRMKKAKKLLIAGDYKIKEICIKVGIPDYNYFSKIFKKYYGVTPSAYKKNFV